jgi:hypothetical protein
MGMTAAVVAAATKCSCLLIPGCADNSFSIFLLRLSMSRVLRSISSERRLRSNSHLAMAAS